MASFPWFPMYAGDFLGSTAAAVMTTEQVGAYFLLLLRCWDSDDCTIPDDDLILASYTKLGERWLNGCSTVVKRSFMSVRGKPGFLTNKRLKEEWEKVKIKHDSARQAGIKSGEKRKTNGRSTDVQRTGNQSQSDLSSLSPSSPSVLRNGKENYSLTELIEKFNAIPGVRKCKVAGKTIAASYMARCQERTDRSTRNWWDAYISQVANAPFLTGHTEGANGPFHVSLSFILGPKNMDKILAGNYDPQPTSKPVSKTPRNPDAKTLLAEIDPQRV